MNYQILVGNKKFSVNVIEVGSGVARVSVDGQPYDITIENYGEVAGASAPAAAAASAAPPPSPAPAAPAAAQVPAEPTPAPPPRPAAAATAGGTPLLAPMPGVIVGVKVRVGDTVVVDQTVVTMEAMKMENAIAAPASGMVREILVSPGTNVATGDLILIIG